MNDLPSNQEPNRDNARESTSDQFRSPELTHQIPLTIRAYVPVDSVDAPTIDEAREYARELLTAHVLTVTLGGVVLHVVWTLPEIKIAC